MIGAVGAPGAPAAVAAPTGGAGDALLQKASAGKTRDWSKSDKNRTCSNAMIGVGDKFWAGSSDIFYFCPSSKGGGWGGVRRGGGIL